MNKNITKKKDVIFKKEHSNEIEQVIRKTGRPKSEDPKNKRVSMRVNNDDYITNTSHMNECQKALF